MHSRWTILLFLSGLFLLAPASVVRAQWDAGFLSVQVTVMDDCLLASANRQTVAGSGADSNFNMLCNLASPYIFSIEDASGRLLSTVVVADDGFGYQYRMVKGRRGSYSVEVCDSLDDVPETLEPLPFANYVSNKGQVSLGTDDKVTIKINW